MSTRHALIGAVVGTFATAGVGIMTGTYEYLTKGRELDIRMIK